MKINFLVLFWVIIFTSHAYSLEPGVGDTVEYKTTYSEKSGQWNSFWKKTILDVQHTGNEWLGDEYLVKWESKSNTIHKEWILLGVLGYVLDANSLCLERNRPPNRTEIEYIKTPMGEFRCCKVLEISGTATWYSDEVPFGVVKRVHTFNDGAISEDMLVSFSRE